MNISTDHLTTGLGLGTAGAYLSQIDFTNPGWKRQVLVAVGIAVMGYFTNKMNPPAKPPAA